MTESRLLLLESCSVHVKCVCSGCGEGNLGVGNFMSKNAKAYFCQEVVD